MVGGWLLVSCSPQWAFGICDTDRNDPLKLHAVVEPHATVFIKTWLIPRIAYWQWTKVKHFNHKGLRERSVSIEFLLLHELLTALTVYCSSHLDTWMDVGVGVLSWYASYSPLLVAFSILRWPLSGGWYCLPQDLVNEAIKEHGWQHRTLPDASSYLKSLSTSSPGDLTLHQLSNGAVQWCLPAGGARHILAVLTVGRIISLVKWAQHRNTCVLHSVALWDQNAETLLSLMLLSTTCLIT